MRPVIYISGPISNGGKATKDERLANVKTAIIVLLELANNGFAPICPQLTEWVEYLTGTVLSHSEWMAIDIPIVDRCDAVYRIAGESLGADLECDHAISANIPIFTDIESIVDYFYGPVRKAPE